MHDTIAFMNSAARNGLTAVPPAAGEDVFTVQNTNDLVPRKAGVISGVHGITAAIANLAQARMKRALDENWVDIRLGISDQTGLRKDMLQSYPVKNDDILRCEMNNGNNAQYDCMLAHIAYDGVGPRATPIGPIPPKAFWIFGTGTGTMVAATWTKSTMTWGATLARTKRYRVIGVIGQSATMYALRLTHKGASPNVGDRPGCPGHDTAALAYAYYGDFGTFIGDQPPDIQALCGAGDTATYVGLLLLEV